LGIQQKSASSTLTSGGGSTNLHQLFFNKSPISQKQQQQNNHQRIHKSELPKKTSSSSSSTPPSACPPSKDPKPSSQSTLAETCTSFVKDASNSGSSTTSSTLTTTISCRRELDFSDAAKTLSHEDHDDAKSSETKAANDLLFAGSTPKSRKSTQQMSAAVTPKTRRRSAGVVTSVLKTAANPVTRRRSVQERGRKRNNANENNYGTPTNCYRFRSSTPGFKSRDVTPRRSFITTLRLQLSGSKKSQLKRDLKLVHSDDEDDERKTSEEFLQDENENFDQNVVEAKRQGLPVIPFLNSSAAKKQPTTADSDSKFRASNKENIVKGLPPVFDMKEAITPEASYCQKRPPPATPAVAKQASSSSSSSSQKHHISSQPSSLYLTMNSGASATVRALATPAGPARYHNHQRATSSLSSHQVGLPLANNSLSVWKEPLSNYQLPLPAAAAAKNQHCQSCTCNQNNVKQKLAGSCSSMELEYVKMGIAPGHIAK
jgi:hypothetical protein